MSGLALSSLFNIVLKTKSSGRFLVGTIASLSFSMAVILSTIGLMDGFEFSLKKALAFSNGDIKFIPRDGFFSSNEKLSDLLDFDFIQNHTSVLQVEAFAIGKSESKGVLLKGIEKVGFAKLTGINTKKLDKGVLIGKQYQQRYNLEVGDRFVLAFASERAKDQGSAHLEEFSVDGVVEHGIYEKDFRFMYINKKRLEELLRYKANTSNLGLISIQNFSNIDESIKVLSKSLGGDYRFEPYWSEFEVLLEAVEIEKHSISLILQLIVLVAILNVVGFIIFLSETRAQDFFMLRTLGLSGKSFQRFWFSLLLGIWFVGCWFASALVWIFSEVILKLPSLKIPGDIYVLSQLRLVLGIDDYVYVYGISLVWILLIGFLSTRSLRKDSLVSGLRKEFS